jgi:hypothetical protein
MQLAESKISQPRSGSIHRHIQEPDTITPLAHVVDNSSIPHFAL